MAVNMVDNDIFNERFIMNGYKGFWNGKNLEVQADTSYEAQQLFIPMFQAGTRKKVKGYDITVCLCEIDSKQVTHKADF